ncbi:MAG: molybdopterin-dependent oxidoreductase, partial [Candidatus Methanofastidiosia archaeon]
PNSGIRDEKSIPSVCLQCPAGCGIKVKVVNGRAVKIEGNPLHPINKGKLCPKGQSGLQILYNPDRIKGPMRQVGEKGSGKWERISWSNAIEIISNRLRELRERDESYKLVLMEGRVRGQMNGLLKRFMKAYGSPNIIGHGSICADSSKFAHYLTQGFKHYAAYDWENTNYLLCFGAGFIEAWRPTTLLLRAYGHMRRERTIRAKIVQVDTRFSVSAAKADEWIPIKPGTDGALALGIAHIIIREELYDKEFVKEHTQGFEKFKELVLRKYPPKYVSLITGVQSKTIERIAREFATTKPQIAAGERGSSMQSNGVYSRMAIHALNALVGSIESPGGIIVQKDPPFTPWHDLKLDEVTAKCLEISRIDSAGTKRFPLAGKVYQNFPDAILSGKPYEIDTLLLYYTNPLFSSPDVRRFYDAFEKIPFIVDFTPFMSESTEFADLILPDSTYLERWHDDVIYPSLGYPVVGLRQPVVDPLYDSKNTGDVLIMIAKKIGGGVSEAFPWNDFKEVLKFRFKGLHQAMQGSIVENDFDEFWSRFEREGVWENGPYEFGEWERVHNTPSKKFELYSLNLKKKLEDVAKREAERTGRTQEQELELLLQDMKITARGDEAYMPHYEPIKYVGDEAEYPFHLNTYKLMTHAEGRGANLPFLQ